jgi:hypothetical protein
MIEERNELALSVFDHRRASRYRERSLFERPTQG